MVRAVAAAALLSLLWLAPAATATDPAPWKVAGDVELALADAETALILGDAAAARANVSSAERAVAGLLAGRPQALRVAERALGEAATAVTAGDQAAFATARALVWTTILRASLLEATCGRVVRRRRGGAELAARPRVPAADAVLPRRGGRDRRARRARGGSPSPREAAATVRRDLLDTYDSRLRTALAGLRAADEQGFAATRAEMGALALGYWRIVAPAYADARGARAERSLTRSFEQLALAAGDSTALGAPLARIETALAAFRAAPLTEAELVQRAGQLDRFLRLVPIEYGRGVKDGRVTLDFEIQEAVTFRDGAASAFTDLRPTLASTDARATARLSVALDELGTALADAARGDAVAEPDVVTGDDGRSARTDRRPLPDGVEGGREDGRLRRHRRDARPPAGGGRRRRLEAGRVRRGSRRTASSSSARSSDFAGSRRRCSRRSRATSGTEPRGHDGLVQLLGRHAPDEEIVDDARGARRCARALGAADRQRPAVGRLGGHERAIIVFREGLEAVLILAALMASLVGAQRHFRRPMFVGVGARARRERGDVGRRADRADVARGLRREARGDRLARRHRRPPPDPELVLPPRLLAGEPPGAAPEEASRPRGSRALARHRAGRRARRCSASRASTARASRRCSSSRR